MSNTNLKECIGHEVGSGMRCGQPWKVVLFMRCRTYFVGFRPTSDTTMCTTWTQEFRTIVSNSAAIPCRSLKINHHSLSEKVYRPFI